jgi:hypothetical protein
MTAPKPATCDFAACHDTATVRRDGWAFCEPHGKRHSKLAIAPEATPAQPPSDDIRELLEQASRNRLARIRVVGARVERYLDELRKLIAEQVEIEHRKAEVARLEAELAAARAQVRRKPQDTPTAQPQAQTGIPA